MPGRASEKTTQTWTDRVRNQIESGLSIKRFCLENQLNFNTFQYWRYKFRKEKKITKSSFVELVDKSSAGITIEVNSLRIRLEHNFDPNTLKAALEILKSL